MSRVRFVLGGIALLLIVAATSIGWTMRDTADDVDPGDQAAREVADGPTEADPTPVEGRPSADPVELAKSVSGLTDYYASALKVDRADAECIAETVVGWQAGPDAVPDGASKPLTHALEECGLSLGALDLPSPDAR